MVKKIEPKSCQSVDDTVADSLLSRMAVAI